MSHLCSCCSKCWNVSRICFMLLFFLECTITPEHCFVQRNLLLYIKCALFQLDLLSVQFIRQAGCWEDAWASKPHWSVIYREQGWNLAPSIPQILVWKKGISQRILDFNWWRALPDNITLVNIALLSGGSGCCVLRPVITSVKCEGCGDS